MLLFPLLLLFLDLLLLLPLLLLVFGVAEVVPSWELSPLVVDIVGYPYVAWGSWYLVAVFVSRVYTFQVLQKTCDYTLGGSKTSLREEGDLIENVYDIAVTVYGTSFRWDLAWRCVRCWLLEALLLFLLFQPSDRIPDVVGHKRETL